MCVRPESSLSMRSASRSSAGFPYTRPSSTTAVSTPSVTRPSAWTERAFPSACARTSSLGLEPRRVVLDVVGRDDLEGDGELLEDRPPLRRGRGEDEAVRSSAEVPPELRGVLPAERRPLFSSTHSWKLSRTERCLVGDQ